MTQVAGHLQEKKGYYYAVLSYKDENGRRKTKWVSTKLPVKGNKKKAEAILTELRRTFSPPRITEGIKPDGEYQASQMRNMLFADYMIYKGNDTYNINSCETIEVFYNLRTDLDKLNFAVEATKIIRDVTE